MKKLTLALAFLFCSPLFAQTQGLHQFEVEKAEFSPAQVQSPLNATMTVDYNQFMVTLLVNRAMPPCPAGKMCAQVMPEPLIVHLPIIKIEKTNCGIFHVIAQQDLRTADGALEKIELDDTTGMNCKTMIRYNARATYETTLLDRSSGKEATALSTMNIVPVSDPEFAIETLNFVKGSFLKGFPTSYTPGSGTLTLGTDKVGMNINVTINCSEGICPRIMPQPLNVELPVIKIEKTDCAYVTTARRDSRATDGGLEEIQVMDYQHSACQFIIKPLVEVHYKTILQGRGQAASETEAVFSFDR